MADAKKDIFKRSPLADTSKTQTKPKTGQRKMKLFSWLAYQFDYIPRDSSARAASLRSFVWCVCVSVA